MDFIIAIIFCFLVGLGAGYLFRFRFPNSTFTAIQGHVTALVAILLFSFFLFFRLGLNIWSAATIPVVALVFAFFLIRNAIAKLLETH